MASDEHYERDPKIYLQALKKFVKEKDVSKVRDIVALFYPADIIEQISSWKIEQIVALLSQLSTDKAVSIFVLLPSHQIEKLIPIFNKEDLKEMLNSVDIDEFVDLCSKLSKKTQDELISFLKLTRQKKVEFQLKNNKETVGFHMHQEYVAINENLTVKEALEEIEKKVWTNDKEIAGDVFVVTKNQKILGYVKTESLLTTNSNEKISSISNPPKTLFQEDTMVKAGEYIKKYDLPSLPIINSENILVGVIEAGDVIDFLQEKTNSNHLKADKSFKNFQKYLPTKKIINEKQRKKTLIFFIHLVGWKKNFFMVLIFLFQALFVSMLFYLSNKSINSTYIVVFCILMMDFVFMFTLIFFDSEKIYYWWKTKTFFKVKDNSIYWKSHTQKNLLFVNFCLFVLFSFSKNILLFSVCSGFSISTNEILIILALFLFASLFCFVIWYINNVFTLKFIIIESKKQKKGLILRKNFTLSLTSILFLLTIILVITNRLGFI